MVSRQWFVFIQINALKLLLFFLNSIKFDYSLGNEKKVYWKVKLIFYGRLKSDMNIYP